MALHRPVLATSLAQVHIDLGQYCRLKLGREIPSILKIELQDWTWRRTSIYMTLVMPLQQILAPCWPWSTSSHLPPHSAHSLSPALPALGLVGRLLAHGPSCLLHCGCSQAVLYGMLPFGAAIKHAVMPVLVVQLASMIQPSLSQEASNCMTCSICWRDVWAKRAASSIPNGKLFFKPKSLSETDCVLTWRFLFLTHRTGH